MITYANNYYPVVRLLHVALSCICQIDSNRIHICDRGWELLIKIDDADVNIPAVAKFSLDVCTALFKYSEAHYEFFAQFDEDLGEIRIPYKDIEPALYYATCVQDHNRFSVLETVTT